MKLPFKTICLLVGGCALASIGTFHAQPREKGLKKGANLALNITNNRTFPPRTYVNFGLLSNYKSLEGIGLNAVSSITHFHSKGVQLAGITNITGLDVSGFQISGIANVTGRDTKGIVLSGLMNISGRTTSGFVLSGIGNFSGESCNGMAVAGLININGKNTSGVHVAGLANITSQTQSGVMLGGLMNVAGDTLRGMQLSALLNVSAGTNRGAQVAALGNVSVENNGLQAGVINYSERNKGLQAGIANVSSATQKGLQLGFVNISRDSMAHQIGCINLNRSTRIQMIVSGGNLNKVGAAVRFKNKHTYTELGTGAFVLGFGQKFSLSGSYRAGLYFPVSPKLELSADAGFHHIEALGNKNRGCPARLYALQPRFNLEYRLNRRFALFASGGYSWTRRYGHSSSFGHKTTFDIGIVLF